MSTSLKDVPKAVSFKMSLYKPTPTPNNDILYSRSENLYNNGFCKRG